MLDQYLENGKALLGDINSGRPSPIGDWMGNLRGSTKLPQLTIPGTHDSAAWNCKSEPEWWNCQDMPLFSQLDTGVRGLDIRYARESDKLVLVHAMQTLDDQASLLDILMGLHAWLKLHPTETLFVSLKNDRANYTGDNGQRQRALDIDHIQRVIEETIEKGIWLENVSTCTTLDQARGKLVLIQRFEIDRHEIVSSFDVSKCWLWNHEGFTIGMKENTQAHIEDFYLFNEEKHLRNIEYYLYRKEEVVNTHLRRAQESTQQGCLNLWITFTSAVGDKRVFVQKDGVRIYENITPKDVALGRAGVEGINDRLMRFLQKTKQEARFPFAWGILLIDFVTSRKTESSEIKMDDTSLIRQLIELNSYLSVA